MNAEKVENTRYLPDRDSQNIQMVNSMSLKPILNEETESFTRLKLKINNLLWEELPENVTIGQAEEVACAIMSKIVEFKETEK